MKHGHRQVKLSVRKETLRRLDALTDNELRRIAGGDLSKNLLSRTCTKTTTSECNATFDCPDR